MNAFTIKDLENLSGVKAHTIRIWEQRYGFLKPKRTTTNIRYYSNDELKTVLNIALLNKYGFKISHIDRMQPGEVKEKILSLGHEMAVKERLVNDLMKEMIDMEMDKFEKIINGHIASKGIEKTVLQIIFPFLEKIGILWQTGNIHPAQEHLVSNIIRQKLIVAIETTVCRIKSDKTYLLFLPEGEHHELGLLFVYYLLKSRGAKTIYLGANVPLADVKRIVELKLPDRIFIHLPAGIHFNFEKFLHTIHQKLEIPAIISGQVTCNYYKNIPDTIQFKKSLQQVMEYMAEI